MTEEEYWGWKYATIKSRDYAWHEASRRADIEAENSRMELTEAGDTAHEELMRRLTVNRYG